MKISKTLLPVVAVAALFSGCQDEDFGYESQDIKNAKYEREFINVFGEIDPNQNWDLYGQLASKGSASTRSSVDDIIISKPGEESYHLITKDDNQAFQNMLPESEIKDAAYDETNLGKVTQNFITTSNEITLYPIHWNTSGSDIIGIYYYTNDPAEATTTITGQDGKTYYIVRKEVYYNKTMVDKIFSVDAYLYTNQPKYFDGTADGYTNMFTILAAKYPEKYVIIDDEKKVIVGEDVFTTNEYYSNHFNDIAQDLIDCGKGKYVEEGEPIKDPWGNTIAEGSFVYVIGTTQQNKGAAGTQDLSAEFSGDIKYLLTKPTVITIPEDIQKVGFYIRNGSDDNIKYSESNLNAKVKFKDKDEEIEACFVATYIDENTTDANDQTVRYLCFEDWMGDNRNFDLNDVIFRVYGLEDHIIDHDEEVDVDTEEAILVCEDLGDFDFDFNDIVLKLSVSTTTTTDNVYVDGVLVESNQVVGTPILTITPMAAGGTLESYVIFNDVPLAENDGNEIHKLLSGEAPEIINAGPSFGSEGSPISIALTGELGEKGNYPTILSQLFQSGKIQIKVEGKTSANVISNDYKNAGCPQMILLPVGFEWSQEMNPINDAYPGFIEWVNDATKTDWISSQAQGNGKVTSRGTNTQPSIDPSEPTDPENPSEPEEEPEPEVEPETNLTGNQISGTTINASVFSAISSDSKITVKINASEGGTIYFHYPNTYDSPTASNLSGGNLTAVQGENIVEFTSFDVDKLKNTGLDLMYMKDGSKVWVTIE